MSASVVNEGARTGFFGKVPVHGDFVARALPRPVVDAWHGWLEGAMAGAIDTLGADWLDIYLTCPVWRFALSPGLCGPTAVAGVMIPSVDKVGRYFPFAILHVAGGPATATRLAASAAWYDAVEELALGILAWNADIGRLEIRVGELAPPRLDGEPPEVDKPPMMGSGWRIGSMQPAPAGPAWGKILDRLFTERYGKYALWWTHGSDRVSAGTLVGSGLPSGAAFAAFLDGEWTRHGWLGGDAARPEENLP